jgi:hypothetical protein
MLSAFFEPRRTTDLEGPQTMTLKLSIACILSTLFLGVVIADAVDAPLPKRTGEPATWITTVFKNPH